MERDTLLEMALVYAEHGWPVFPCIGKDPAIPKDQGGHGYLDATTDPEQIKAWWKRYPRANIGFHPAGAGLLAVDADDSEAKALAQELGLMAEPTRTHTTQRGWHRFYKHPGGTISNKSLRQTPDGPKLDIRCDHGYVILPPSTHPDGGRYKLDGATKNIFAELPDRVVRMLRNGKQPGPAPPIPETISTGERNNTLTSLAGSMRRRGATENEIFAALEVANFERCSPQLDDSELRAIAASVSTYPPEPPRPQIEAPPDTPLAQPTAGIVRPVTLGQFYKEIGNIENEAEWLIDGLVALGSLGGITGKPKVGKTTYKIAEALAISRGWDFCGRKTRQSRVLWLNLEQPKQLLAWKLQQMCAEDNPDFMVIPWATRKDLNPTILEKWIAEFELSYVVIDSLSKWWTVSEETDNVQIEQSMQTALAISHNTHAHFGFIHHPPKHMTGSMTVMDMFRGGGAIGANLDLGGLIEKDKIGNGTVRKLRYESRVATTPTIEYVELVGNVYKAAEDPKHLEQRREREAVLGVLTTIPQTREAIIEQLGNRDLEITDKRTWARLRELMEQGDVEKDEKQGRKDTYRLKRTV